ncbi:MAG: hypothetical protein H0U65_15270 [Rubrobacter sp.]|jgi:hypothetical protein|nr:hypothetical protein [Rubrobacter sp.]
MHGINREQNMQGTADERGGVRRVIIRYADGRTINVMPDARRKQFSGDDAKEFRKILDKASTELEWADVSSRPTM